MSTLTFDSAALYTTLLSAQAQIRQYVHDRTGDTGYNVRVVYWGHGADNQHFELTIIPGYSDKVEVKGKHLEQMVEEALRRLGFAQQQEHLQLSHLTEAEFTDVPAASVAEPVDLPTSSEDEIPY